MPRHRIPINASQVEQFTLLGSPASEIADYFGVPESTIRRRFAKTLRRVRALRRIHLRGFQWNQARSGSVSLLILLGKLELGQREDIDGSGDRVIVRRVVQRPKTIGCTTPLLQ